MKARLIIVHTLQPATLDKGSRSTIDSSQQDDSDDNSIYDNPSMESVPILGSHLEHESMDSSVPSLYSGVTYLDNILIRDHSYNVLLTSQFLV